jgi:broad specificity phosphatase PhoE
MAARFLAVILAGMALCAAPPSRGAAAEGTTVLYLVRHAEKAAEPGDPPLTRDGLQRAERIAAGLENRHIEAIWSTDYRRTRQTAAPASRRLGPAVGIYDPQDQEAFAERLLAEAKNALVVGHSNTIPALASLLCGCVVAPMHDTEYGRLLVITIDRHGTRLEELRQRDFFREPAQP